MEEHDKIEIEWILEEDYGGEYSTKDGIDAPLFCACCGVDDVTDFILKEKEWSRSEFQGARTHEKSGKMSFRVYYCKNCFKHIKWGNRSSSAMGMGCLGLMAIVIGVIIALFYNPHELVWKTFGVLSLAAVGFLIYSYLLNALAKRYKYPECISTLDEVTITTTKVKNSLRKQFIISTYNKDYADEFIKLNNKYSTRVKLVEKAKSVEEED